jgi:hypothetical protein
VSARLNPSSLVQDLRQRTRGRLEVGQRRADLRPLSRAPTADGRVVWRAALGSGSDGGPTGGSWWRVVAVVVVWGGGGGVGWRWWCGAATVVLGGGGGVRRWWWWRRFWWCGERRWWGQGSRPVGPLPWNSFFCFMKISCAESNTPLGTRVTRASDVALGKEVFAGPAVPRALCRVFPLGTGCAERNWACAESIALSAKP